MFFGSSLAAADGARAHLTWHRPVASLCPSAEALVRDAEQLAERALFTDAAKADLLVDGLVVDSESGVTARLEARRRDGRLLGRRQLYAPPGLCASLRRSLALVLLMLLERAEQPEPLEPELNTQGWVGAGLLQGTLSRAAPGVSAGLTLTVRENLQLRADSSYWLPISSATTDGEGATLRAWGLGLAGCPRLAGAGAPFQLWLCGGTQLGALIAQPHGLDGAGRQTRLLAQLTVELKLAAHVSEQASLELSVGPVVSLSRPRVFFTRTDGATVDVARPEPLGAILRLAIVVQRL